MSEINSITAASPSRVAELKERPFDALIPITMSHYPITYSGVINNPSEDTLRYYLSRLDSHGPSRKSAAMLYIHIPFCDQICTFCRYARQKTPERGVFERYSEALKQEMRRYLEYRYVQEMEFDLVYLGGGTPSVMPLELMDDLLAWIDQHFTRGNKEISFEGEARTLQEIEYLEMLKEHGVSRVSMGVQSFDPELRKRLGRHEKVDDINRAIENAKKLDIDINFDLLYWLPYQTISHIEADIEAVRQLNPTDIDWYNMVYDPLLKNDPLSRLVTRKDGVLEDTEGLLRTREAMRDGLRSIGFQQHFVDNFACSDRKDTYHVLRTGNYDGSAQTLGVGVSSLGTIGNFVYLNAETLESYYSALETRARPYKWVFDLTSQRQIERVLFHFARNMVLPKVVFERVEPKVAAPYLQRVHELVDKGMVDETEQYFVLSEEGKLWYGNVASHLLGHVDHEKMLKKLYKRILQ